MLVNDGFCVDGTADQKSLTINVKRNFHRPMWSFGGPNYVTVIQETHPLSRRVLQLKATDKDLTGVRFLSL